MKDFSELKNRFASRRKLLSVRDDVQQIANLIRSRLAPSQKKDLRDVLDQQHPADLADAMLFLKPEEDSAVFAALDMVEAAEVLDEVDAQTRTQLVRDATPSF